MDKEKLKAETMKWGKRAAFFAVFGVTGAAALLAISAYKTIRGINNSDWDNLKL